jgi:hypothetical protein
MLSDDKEAKPTDPRGSDASEGGKLKDDDENSLPYYNYDPKNDPYLGQRLDSDTDSTYREKGDIEINEGERKSKRQSIPTKRYSKEFSGIGNSSVGTKAGKRIAVMTEELKNEWKNIYNANDPSVSNAKNTRNEWTAEMEKTWAIGEIVRERWLIDNENCKEGEMYTGVDKEQHRKITTNAMNVGIISVTAVTVLCDM